MLKGTVVAESLRPGTDLRVAGLRMPRLSREDLSASVMPGQPPVWTLLEIEAEDDAADTLALLLSQSLLAEGGWYADFAVGGDHVVVYADRIFRYTAGDRTGRAQAEGYGRRMGVPDSQLDWPDQGTPRSREGMASACEPGDLPCRLGQGTGGVLSTPAPAC